MMALHQLLEARLDVGPLGVDLQAERVERLALGVAHGAPLGLRPGLLLARAGAELAKHLERIVGRLIPVERLARPRLVWAPVPHPPPLPGRPVAGERGLLVEGGP